MFGCNNIYLLIKQNECCLNNFDQNCFRMLIKEESEEN